MLFKQNKNKTPTESAASLSTPTSASTNLQPEHTDNTFTFPQETEPTVYQLITLDPIGNGMAIMVLILMITILLGAIVFHRTTSQAPNPIHSQIIIPILSLPGLGIASYLSYVEISQTTAICSPVGD